MPDHEWNLREGDCLSTLREYPAEKFDLAYLDPPFFTNKIHTMRTRDRSKEFSFEDLWSSHREYAEFLFERIVEVYRVMSAEGALFFHCDRHSSHLARGVLDEVFGPEFFRSEIIWHYRRWSNSKKGLLPAHQTILYYTKSSSFTFNTLMQGYSPSTNVDQILQQRARDDHGKSVYRRTAAGDVVMGDGKKGVPLGDVWDIPYLNPKARERVGYPTQKPLLLLERILCIATNESDWVLDPFCGSGTTLVAAKLLGRNAVGIDSSSEAIELAERRLAAPVKSNSRLLSVGREAYRNADQDALALLSGVPCVPVHRNKGIDAILVDGFEGAPVTIRVQREGEALSAAAQLLKKASESKGAKVMFLVRTRPGGDAERFPQCIVVVDSPRTQIGEKLRDRRGGKSDTSQEEPPLTLFG